MEELYRQTFGKKRIVAVVGWNENDVLLDDLKSELKYAINWNLFFDKYKKVEPYDVDIEDYTGCDLDKLLNK